MKVWELIDALLDVPSDMDVCVPDTAQNQTTDAYKAHVQLVYGVECFVIEPENEEDDDE